MPRLLTILTLCLLTSPALSGWIPTPVGRWDLPPDAGAAVALHVQDGLALVAVDDSEPPSSAGRVWPVDLSDPAAPVPGDALYVVGAPTSIARAGDLAVVASYQEGTNRGVLLVIDLAAPGGPEPLSEITVYGAPEDVVWRNGYLIAGVRGTGAGIDDHLLMTDARDPANPVYVTTQSLPYATTSMALDGTTLYAAGDDDGVPQLEWFDASDPTWPDLEESYGLSFLFLDLEPRGERIHTLVAGGTYLLCDLSHEFLWLRGTHALGSTGLALDVLDDIVYVAGGNLTVIDARAPDDPVEVGGYAAGTAVDVALADEYVVMLDAGGLWTMTLYDPPTPVAVDAFAARDVGGAVELRWWAEELGADRFRVRGEAAGRSWDVVGITPDGEGRFSARDTQAPVGGVAYTLSADDGERWIEVGRTTVLLSPPPATVLDEPYPNPFNPLVNVPYTLSRPGHVVLSVHDPRGRRMAVLVDGEMPIGRHRAKWDGVDEQGRILPSGTYHMRLDVDGEITTRPVTLLR